MVGQRSKEEEELGIGKGVSAPCGQCGAHVERALPGRQRWRDCRFQPSGVMSCPGGKRGRDTVGIVASASGRRFGIAGIAEGFRR